MIGLAAYGSYYAPILYSDDWSLILGRWYEGNLRWFSVDELRPLQLAPFVVLYGLFGPNLHAFYLLLWILNVLAAIQLYFLLKSLLPNHTAFALGVAAIFLVYPAEFTHMWLTQIHARIAFVLVLAYAHLLLMYSRNGRSRWLWLGLFCGSDVAVGL